MKKLTGQTVMVTGGGTGFGRHFAHVLAKAGAAVAITARRKEKIHAVASEIIEAGGKALAIPMDVTKRDSVEAAFAEMKETLGPVHVLVNNAGIATDKLLLNLEEEDWDNVVDTNLKGVFLCAKAAAQQMIDAGQGGSIINIASVLAERTQKGTGPYAAAKAGLVHLTHNMAAEWARYRIRVNALAPGYFVTDIAGDFLNSPKGQELVKSVPMRRWGEFDDLTEPLLLLAGEGSCYMTGSVLTVDGGHTLHFI